MMVWMLFNPDPDHIVQLGLGSASLTRFCYYHFPLARVTAVEINPSVIALCRERFFLPENDEYLTVLNQPAQAYLTEGRSHVDVLQVDLYDEHARAPVLDTPAFYRSCADVLKKNGMMVINIFGAQSNRRRTIRTLNSVFDSAVWLPATHDAANVVALAFKDSPVLAFDTLYERAGIIRQKTGLSAESWVDGLLAWTQR
jgi:spermidine synthase